MVKHIITKEGERERGEGRREGKGERERGRV